ncbi:MAG: CDGSH iron-sulfur domain-containing protein [Planctomycetota bacterium]
MSDATISVKTNGPFRVEGSFRLCDNDGNQFDLGGRGAISLCRCGLSTNQPLCDGAHAKEGFESACPARDLSPPGG